MKKSRLSFTRDSSLSTDIHSSERTEHTMLIDGHTQVLRIYSDEQGDSHLEELTIATEASRNAREAKPIPATGALIREYQPQLVRDWHTVPHRQFAITIVGALDVEVSGGIRRHVHKGELVFLEDTKGKGHITHMEGPVVNFFIQVPDNFDVLSWSRGNC